MSDSEESTHGDSANERQAVVQSQSFKDLGVTEVLCEACRQLNWSQPTEIQCRAIPAALQGKDIIALAETGSGKSGAFAIPIVQHLLTARQKNFALVLTPTRELAFQLSEQFGALGSSVGINVIVIVGGVDMTTQSISLAKRPHIIIATPGRMADHLEHTKGFNLKSIKYLVLDEADRILNMDFGKEVDLILKNCPSDRRTLLFSATMTQKVQKLQRASLNNPVRIEVTDKYHTVDKLHQFYVFVPAKYKDTYLVYMLNDHSGQSIIIFTATCQNTLRLALLLRNLGFSAIPLNGQLNQSKRMHCLNEFKAKQSSILIATDVASRGLDIPHVDLVVNFDIPSNIKDYVHRVGRTARAGRHGKAVAMVTQYDIESYQRVEHGIKKKLPLYDTPKEQVMKLQESVQEAQNLANVKMKAIECKRGKGTKRTMSKAKLNLGGDEHAFGVRKKLRKQTKLK